MLAEVIAIGDELTSGLRVDTNSAWLSQRLAEIGIRTVFHTTVADDEEACADAFRLASRRADVAVVTGGLGPTADDLTRASLAKATGRSLELRDDILTQIQELYNRRNRTMPDSNSVQAMFPVGSSAIDNPHGTAPGIDLALSDPIATRFFCLPGVPAEMKQMWNESVRPTLVEMSRSENASLETGDRTNTIKHFTLKCFGVGESNLEAMLPDLIRRGRQPTVGITVHRGTISLRISAEAESESECDRQIQATAATIRDCLGRLVFGEGDDELQHVVLRLLGKHRQSLATAEWATPGLLAHWLQSEQSDVDNAAFGSCGVRGNYFRGGITVADQEAAESALGQHFGSVSSANAEVFTRKMADSVRARFGTDLALAVGPVTSDQDSATGCPKTTLWIAFAHKSATFCISSSHAAHPDILDALAAKRALNIVREHLIDANAL